MTTTRIQQLVDTHEFGLLGLTTSGEILRISWMDEHGRVHWTKLDVDDGERKEGT